MANASEGRSPSLDELLQFIAATVADRFASTQSPTNGTFLAEQIRHRFPDLKYVELGLSKLAEAVSVAEARHLVVRNRSVKHLEVVPPSAIFKAAPTTRNRSTQSQHIRQDVWRSFVFVAPTRTQYFDREQGRVIDAAVAGPAPDPSRFIKVPQIPLETQKEWMQEFAASEVTHNASDAPIHDPYCFIKFPAWLRGLDATLERKWKAFRVRRVLDLVREWAQEHSISTQSLISGPIPISDTAAGLGAMASEERDIRSAVIAALNELPVEKWDAVCTLIRWIIRAHNGR